MKVTEVGTKTFSKEIQRNWFTNEPDTSIFQHQQLPIYNITSVFHLYFHPHSLTLDSFKVNSRKHMISFVNILVCISKREL